MKNLLKTDELSILDRFPGGTELHLKIKAGLTLKNKSLSAWGREHNIHYANVKLITHGLMNGEKGQRLRLKLIKDAGLLEDAA